MTQAFPIDLVALVLFDHEGCGQESPAATERFTEQLRGMGVEFVDSILSLLGKVDVVLLESVDVE